jgi:hypothetical protein
MKQVRGLLIAAIVLAGLSGLVYWSNKHKAAEAAKPPADVAPKILTLDEKQVDEVTIRKAGGEPFVISRIGDRWEISKPEPMAADQDAVNSIVSTASALTSDRLIDEKPDSLAPFGLANPVTELKFHLKNGSSATLQIGNDTPGGGSTYVKLASTPKIYSLASFSKNNLDKPLNDLRDKRLVTFADADKVARIELTGATGPAIEFGRNAQGDWQIFKPETLRADATQVDELLRKLKEAKIQLDAGMIAESTFKATPKLATVQVTFGGETQTVEFRRDKDKNLYALSSAVTGVYKTGDDITDTLKKSLTDFRSKKLFDFGFNELSQITTAPATGQSAVYVRSGEKWFLNGKEMDAPSIMNLIDKLRDLTAVGFTNNAAGSKVLQVSVTTQDKKRTETVNISRQGTNTVAQREGDPAVYTLDSGAADGLIQAAADVKPAPPAPAKPKKK